MPIWNLRNVAKLLIDLLHCDATDDKHFSSFDH